MAYRSTKTYGHEVGLSACFRQHKAESHCRFIHGYALAFTFVFEALNLDKHGWVVDFGGLKKLKACLVEKFDHRLVIAKDDPLIEHFMKLHEKGAADIIVVDGVGCEAFARLGWEMAEDTLRLLGIRHRVSVVSCEAREHGANSAVYEATAKERL